MVCIPKIKGRIIQVKHQIMSMFELKHIPILRNEQTVHMSHFQNFQDFF